ncbi:phosphonate ABC transporter substrate-binding protein [Roseovarius tibetensis]|uniref:phosphonate ABC transporter substrate-binding protein n=1 Tax=Roseovarius tibetensis TaxID=2685897 RepID=UPI003D7FC228
MFRTTLSAAIVGATALTFSAALAQDGTWRDEVPEFRIGLLGGENEQDRLSQNACLKGYLEERLGVPVSLYPASDYAGVMQGLLAGQLEFAGLGAAGYAGIHLQDPDAVEPLMTTMQIDGSLGYYSVMVTRADSGIETLDDMEGRTLAFADPNSTSGFVVPELELRDQLGTEDLETYFERTNFAGGHEQGVVAVLNGQYDAAVTWASGVGDVGKGYSRGNLRSMVDKGMLDMSDLNIVWQSNLIANGPRVIRSDVPQELKDLVMGALMRLQIEDPDCYRGVRSGDALGNWPVDHAFYETVVDQRKKLQNAAR